MQLHRRLVLQGESRDQIGPTSVPAHTQTGSRQPTGEVVSRRMEPFLMSLRFCGGQQKLAESFTLVLLFYGVHLQRWNESNLLCDVEIGGVCNLQSKVFMVAQRPSGWERA